MRINLRFQKIEFQIGVEFYQIGMSGIHTHVPAHGHNTQGNQGNNRHSEKLQRVEYRLVYRFRKNGNFMFIYKFIEKCPHNELADPRKQGIAQKCGDNE